MTRVLVGLVLVALAGGGCARPPAAPDEPLRLERMASLAPAETPPWALRAEVLRLPQARLDTLPPGTPLALDVFGETLAARVRRTDRAGSARTVTAALEPPHAGALVLVLTPGERAEDRLLVAGTLRWENARRYFSVYTRGTPAEVVLAEVGPGAEDELPGAAPPVPAP